MEISNGKDGLKGGILHVHSMYSLHDSAQTPEEIVKRVKELRYSSVTLTDHGTLMGIPAFMKAGEKYGVNTVPGCEFYVEGKAHLVVVAKDYEGYQSISRALRDAWRHRVQSALKRWVPILTDEVMAEHFKGNHHVFATTACIGGAVSRILLTNFRKKKNAEAAARKAEGLKEYYDGWEKWNTEYLSCIEKIKTLKAEAKEYAPYLTKGYAKKIERMRGEAGQLAFGSDMAVRQEDAVLQMERMAEHAKEATAAIDTEIKQITALRKEAKKNADKCRTKKEQYETLIGMDPGYEEEEEVKLRAMEELKRLAGIFPEFYVELQNHGMEEELLVMPKLVELAAELKIPVIAANDAHITDSSPDAVRSRQVMRFNYFQKAEPVTEADRELYVKSHDELYHVLCQAVGENAAVKALKNTETVDSCRVVFPKGEHYPAVENGEEEFDHLIAEAKTRLQETGEWDTVREKRLAHEVQVIKQMGYVDYHLIVRDFCNMARTLGGVPKSEIANIPNDFTKVKDWCRKRGFDTGIGVGPGRGSAVGSIVCFLLGITDADPVKYDLLFERFLNPERVSMPDIDSDIKTSLRPVIVRYIKWKYGESSVASIATEDTYAAKSALQLAARNIASEKYDNGGLSNAEKKEQKRRFAKHGYRLSDIIEEGGLKENENAILNACSTIEEEQIYRDACLIEGRFSGMGIHAGGIVISDNRDICDYVPLHWVEKKQVWATQCDMLEVENLGLLKMDLLGLGTLDLISDCLQLIKRRHGVKIDLNRIAEDSDVFSEIYTKGYTNSVFQFESPGMKQMLRRFQPESIGDLILLNACFRPGPLQYLDGIIEAKNNGVRRESCLTRIPQLKPILASTYGYPIYQEQVMQIFQVLAGYSLGGADLVRRAMSKKKMDKLEVERKAFLYGDEQRGIKGCRANGIDTGLANELFDQLMDFSKYGFNRSHAMVYAVVSYQMAWLKYYYPAEFACAAFGNEDISDYSKIMEDCRRAGVEVLLPDINRSSFDFTMEDGKIRFGFYGIKGIADRTAVERFSVGNSRRVQPYYSLTDFLTRNRMEDGTLPDKRIMEALIKSGCFDSMIKNREKAFQMYIEAASCVKDEPAEKFKERMEKNERYLRSSSVKDASYNMEQEEGYLGTCISEDPLDGYPDDQECGCVPMDGLMDCAGSVYGYVTEASLTESSNGRKMMVLSLRGKRGKMTALFMGEAYVRYSSSCGRWLNSVVRVEGKINERRGNVFADSISYMMKAGEKFFARIDTEEKARKFLESRKQHGGEPELCCLMMDVSVGNPGGVYRAICPRLVEVRVPENVIREIGAMQYKFS